MRKDRERPLSLLSATCWWIKIVVIYIYNVHSMFQHCWLKRSAPAKISCKPLGDYRKFLEMCIKLALMLLLIFCCWACMTVTIIDDMLSWVLIKFWVDPPPAINWLFHESAAATPSVFAPSLLLVLQSGIHCLIICIIQLIGQTSFERIWNLSVCLLLAFLRQ